ncbi:MAG: TOBE domain-containing protein [Pseudomonadota bacterium]|nr:TOBE domain-containing protein [Pseudomonadota bacterium]
MNVLDAVVTGPGRVRTGRLDLLCDDDRGLGPSALAWLGFRPEAVRVRGVTADDVNAVAVRIESLDFLGAFWRARLRSAQAEASFVADFSTNLMRDLSISEGQTIMVALPAEALRVFPPAGRG